MMAGDLLIANRPQLLGQEFNPAGRAGKNVRVAAAQRQDNREGRRVPYLVAGLQANRRHGRVKRFVGKGPQGHDGALSGINPGL